MSHVRLGFRRPAFWKLALISLTPLSIIYSAITLEHRSFWLDELYTYAASDPQTPFATLLQYQILPDVHPPLYLFIAHLWTMAFGPSELGYRSLSLSFAILTIPASLMLARGLSGSWHDAISLTALIAASPAFLIYSQEARSYSMLLLASCCVYGTTIWLIRSLESGASHRILLALQSTSMLVVGLTHYFGYFISGLAALGTLVIARRCRRNLLPMIMAYAVPGTVMTAWLAYHATHLAGLVSSGAFWIESVSSTSGIKQLITHTTTLLLGFSGTVVVICCCLYVLARYPHKFLATLQQVDFLVLAGVAIGTLAAAFLMSVKVPVLTPRNLIVVLPAIAAVFYLLFRAAPELQPLVLCSICAVALLASAVKAQHNRDLPSWREPAAVIASFPTCTGQPVLIARMGIRSPAMYLYYTGNVKPRFIDIDLQLLAEKDVKIHPQIAEVSASSCPVKFWGAHLKQDQIQAIRAAFQMLAPNFLFIEWEHGNGQEHGAGHLLVIDGPITSLLGRAS
jgi:hypothetical protein